MEPVAKCHLFRGDLNFQGTELGDILLHVLGAFKSDRLKLVAEGSGANGAICKFDTEFLLEFRPGGSTTVFFPEPEVPSQCIALQQWRDCRNLGCVSGAIQAKLVFDNCEPGVDIFGIFSLELGEFDTSQSFVVSDRNRGKSPGGSGSFWGTGSRERSRSDVYRNSKMIRRLHGKQAYGSVLEEVHWQLEEACVQQQRHCHVQQ
jgi:hypothetical protein